MSEATEVVEEVEPKVYDRYEMVRETQECQKCDGLTPVYVLVYVAGNSELGYVKGKTVYDRVRYRVCAKCMTKQYGWHEGRIVRRRARKGARAWVQ